MERPFQPFAHFFLCVLQFFRGLVRLVELRTEAHTLRHSRKKRRKHVFTFKKMLSPLIAICREECITRLCIVFSTIVALFVVIVLRFYVACATFILSWSGYRGGVFH